MTTKDKVLMQHIERYRELSDEYDSAEDELTKLAASLTEDSIRSMSPPSLDGVVERYVTLKIDQEKIEIKRRRMDEEWNRGIVCPDCGGIGVGEIRRTYDREGGQVILRRDTRPCPCCAGSGRLTLQQASKGS